MPVLSETFSLNLTAGNVIQSVFGKLELFSEEPNDCLWWDRVAAIVNVVAEILWLTQGFVLRFVDVEIVALVFPVGIPVGGTAMS